MKLLISSKKSLNEELIIDLKHYSDGQEFILYLNKNNHLNVLETSFKNQLRLDNYFSNDTNMQPCINVDNPLLSFKLYKQIETSIHFRKYGKTIISTPKSLLLRVQPNLIVQKSKKFSLHLTDERNMEIVFTLASSGVSQPSGHLCLTPPISSNKIKPKCALMEYNQFQQKRRSSEKRLSNKEMSPNFRMESPEKTPARGLIKINEFKTPLDSKMNNSKGFQKFGSESTKVSPFSGSLSLSSNNKYNQFTISSFFATPRVPKSQNELFHTPSTQTKNKSLSSIKKNLKFSYDTNKSKEDHSDIKYIICFSNLSIHIFILYSKITNFLY